MTFNANELVIEPAPEIIGAAKILTVEATGITAEVLICPPSKELNVVFVELEVTRALNLLLKLIPSFAI